jgi:pimeloyl-ACP methyl ester carboxylesterase
LAAAEAADVRRIACPTLLVTGDEDAVAAPSAVRAMAEQIGGARVVILNRCGHWATLERAAECSAALKEFLAGRA